MAQRHSQTYARYFGILGCIIVVVGAYIKWSSFGPFYSGPFPTSFGSIEQGFQLLDIPIVLTAILSCLVFLLLWDSKASGFVVLAGAASIIVFSLLHSFESSGSIFNLRYGYFIVLFGAIVIVISGIVKQLRIDQ